MQNAVKQPDSALKFKLGAVVMTRGVSDLMKEHGLEPIQYLRRHAYCEWGNIEEDDAQANENALANGGRIFSAYNLVGMPESRLWVITEADRSATTLLLPSEY